MYEGKCAITGCSIKEVLEAAHVVRHSISGVNHTTNGILLRSDIHSLFDSKKIRINPNDYSIEVDISLRDSSYWKYNDEKINEGKDSQYPSKEYLTIKYNEN